MDPTLAARAEAAHIQRQRQQGLGKPIISAQFKGERFVAVKNRLFHSERFRTFHDFLMRYIMMALGPEWGTAELRKPAVEDRHPVAVWYQSICRHQRKFMTGSGKVHSLPYTGAAAAFLQLAYDLYALDHNAELQDRLVARLRNRQNFPGARYETYVAAIFIRAGFDLAFENEQDGSTSHCEFTATCRRTGKKFSVEAKRREGRRLRFGGLFNDALSKAANYPRIVFMDINTLDTTHDAIRPPFMLNVRRRLRLLEGQPLNGKPRPCAYVVMTNTPWEHCLDGPAPRCTFLAEGFQIPEFKEETPYRTLRDAINARAAHIEIHDLMQSINDHSHIPSTFDGELPEYAFGEAPPRILVGSRYAVPDRNGITRPAVVTSATVAEAESVAYCGVMFDDGENGICTIPLSSEELAAYRRHPDTFFGVPGQRSTRAETPMELYDFFHDTYRHSTKEKLLTFMKDWPEAARLAKMSQSDLASLYAERMAIGAMAHRNKAAHVAKL